MPVGRRVYAAIAIGALDLYQTPMRYACCRTIGGAHEPRSCADCSLTAPLTLVTTTSCANAPLWRSDTRREANTLLSPLVLVLKHSAASGVVPAFSNEALAICRRLAVGAGGGTAGRRSPPSTSWTVAMRSAPPRRCPSSERLELPHPDAVGSAHPDRADALEDNLQPPARCLGPLHGHHELARRGIAVDSGYRPGAVQRYRWYGLRRVAAAAAEPTEDTGVVVAALLDRGQRRRVVITERICESRHDQTRRQQTEPVGADLTLLLRSIQLRHARRSRDRGPAVPAPGRCSCSRHRRPGGRC